MALTVKALLAEATHRLAAAGIDTASLDSRLLLCQTLGKDTHFPLIYPDYEVEEAFEIQFNAWIERRQKKEPVAYIIGKKEFWSLDFIVTCDTLIPRPDSETLVQVLLDTAETLALEKNVPVKSLPLEIVDIGTGTGCILISALQSLPLAKGTAIDINNKTLEVTKENSKLHGVNSRVECKKSNWLENITGTFDIIVSNPPYIAVNEFEKLMDDVRKYEPFIALVSGHDGMDSYRAIASQAVTRLKEKGHVIVETGSTQASYVADIFTRQGFEIIEIRQDMAGIARCVIARKKN